MRNPFVAYLSSLAVVGVIMVAGTSIAHKAEQHYTPIFPSLADFSPPRLWGRESFVPDWQSGEQADIAASAEFMGKWASELRELPSVKQLLPNVNTEIEITVRPIPHWQEVRPFEDIKPLDSSKATTSKFAALGESEVFAFAVRSEQTPVALTASIKDWSLDGQPAKAMSFSARLMLPYLAREQAGKRDTNLVVKPMLLFADPKNTWVFPRSYTMVLCVDIHVARDTQPGLYTANLVLESNGQVLSNTPLEIRVMPFPLRVNNFHAGAFGTTHDIWAGGFTGYYPEMIDMDSRYGFNLAGGFFNKGNEIPFTRDSIDKIIVDRSDPKFKIFDKKMQLLDKYGMGDVLFWNWGGSGKFNQFKNVLKAAGVSQDFSSQQGKQEFADILHAIKNVERVRKWPEIVINPFDEALKDQDATRQVIEAIPFVRHTSPDTRLYMTEWRKGYTRHYQSRGKQLEGKARPRQQEYKNLLSRNEPLEANFDVIGSNIMNAAGRAIQDIIGGEYWHYGGASTLSAAMQFGLGFQPWGTRAESVLIWANYKGTLENQGWTVHYVLQRDPNGRKNRNTRGPVLASSRAYAVREGIDDRKYIETLRYHAWRTGSQEDWQYLSTLSKRVKKLILNKRKIGGIDNVDTQISRHADLYELRAELKDRILALYNRPAADRAMLR